MDPLRAVTYQPRVSIGTDSPSVVTRYEDTAEADTASYGLRTVIAAESFNADHDAKRLHGAFADLKTNENVLTSILAGRSLEQRQSIQEAYTSKYGKGLFGDIGSRVSDNYRRLLLGLFDDAAEFHAKHIHRIVNDILGEDKDTALLEVLYPMSGVERFVVDSVYSDLYNESLLEDVKGQVSGAFKESVVSLLEDDVSENLPGAQEIRKYVNMFTSMTPEEWSPGNNQLMDILLSNTPTTVAAIISAFKSKTHTDLMEFVCGETANNYRSGFNVLLGVHQDLWRFYADQIYESMSGQRKNEAKLIYSIIFRCEMDLGNIADVFQRTYGSSLHSFIRVVTSDDYANMLVALVGLEKNE